MSSDTDYLICLGGGGISSSYFRCYIWSTNCLFCFSMILVLIWYMNYWKEMESEKKLHWWLDCKWPWVEMNSQNEKRQESLQIFVIWDYSKDFNVITSSSWLSFAVSPFSLSLPHKNNWMFAATGNKTSRYFTMCQIITYFSFIWRNTEDKRRNEINTHVNLISMSQNNRVYTLIYNDWNCDLNGDSGKAEPVV